MYNSLTLQPAPLRYVVNHNDYVLLLTDDKIFVHTLDADGYTFTPTIGTGAGNRRVEVYCWMSNAACDFCIQN